MPTTSAAQAAHIDPIPEAPFYIAATGSATRERRTLKCGDAFVVMDSQPTDVAAIDTGTGEAIRLFHPRLQRWSDHFRIHGAMIESLTREGEVTARLLRFNHAGRIVERTILQSAGQYPRGGR